jgi:hypothetical protein
MKLIEYAMRVEKWEEVYGFRRQEQLQTADHSLSPLVHIFAFILSYSHYSSTRLRPFQGTFLRVLRE